MNGGGGGGKNNNKKNYENSGKLNYATVLPMCLCWIRNILKTTTINAINNRRTNGAREKVNRIILNLSTFEESKRTLNMHPLTVSDQPNHISDTMGESKNC